MWNPTCRIGAIAARTLGARFARCRVFVALGALAAVLAAASAPASTSGVIARRGYFTRLTDRVAGDYTIEGFRMSRDGSRIVFKVDQTTTDSRNCYAQQIRMIDADGTGETVVEQGFTYDTGVGNNCATSLFKVPYDISDDGTLIAYTRLNAPDNLVPEIVLYDVPSGQKTSLLMQLPHSSYGEPGLRNIDPETGLGSLRLAGDGDWLFFVNGFGPWGPPGGSGDPEASGRTLYRVKTDGSVAEAIFSNSDIDDVPGVAPGSTEINCSGGRVDSNASGTLVMMPVGGNFPSAHPPRSLLAIDPAVGPGSAQAIRDLTDGWYSGPSMTADGTMYAFHGVAGDPLTGGVFVHDTAGLTAPVLIDRGKPEFNRTANVPFISGDGSAVASCVELGGGQDPSFRWTAVGTTPTIPVSYPVCDGSSSWSQISHDGKRIAFLGFIRRTRFENDPTNLILFEWVDPGAPLRPSHTTVASFGSSPNWFEEIAYPPGGGNYYSYPYLYRTTGANPLIAFAFAYDENAWGIEGVGGFAEDGVYDNGMDDSDPTTGDGIFTDRAYVRYNDFAGDRTGDVIDLLAGVVNETGTMAGVAFTTLPVIAPADARYERRVYDDEADPIRFDGTSVTLTYTYKQNDSDVLVQRFDRFPFDLPGAAPHFWRFFDFDLRGSFSLQMTIQYDIRMFEPGTVSETRLGLWRSYDDGETWEPVPTWLDTVNNMVTSRDLQTGYALWTVAESADSIILGGVLGGDTITSTQLSVLDRNGDRKLDVSDLILLLLSFEASTP